VKWTRASAAWSGESLGNLPRILLLALLACLASCSLAHAQHYTFAQFGQADGLLNQDVSAIVQDGRGVLWVGTENGLFVADGSHFVRIESFRDATYGSVLAMHVDARGRVWVLGAKRLVFFKEDHALHLVSGIDLHLLFNDDVALSSLPDQPDTLFLLQNGRLQQISSADDGGSWESSPVFSEGTVAAHPELGKVSSLAADPGRRALWAGCGEALCELKPAIPLQGSPAYTVWDTSRGIPGDRWHAVMLGRDGRVWARGLQGVLRLDPRTWAADRFPSPAAGSNPLSSDSQLLEDLDGSILANLPDGLARLSNGHWKYFMAANGLPASQIVTMFFDRGGGLWLAPMGGGIWRWLGYRNWQHGTQSEGLSGNVSWGMLRDKGGQLWVATANNLDRIDEALGKAVPQRSDIPMRRLQSMAEDGRGHVWIGSDDGNLFDFDPATKRARKVADSLDLVYRMKGESVPLNDAGAQRVWICTSAGVKYVSAADGWRHIHTVIEDGAPIGNVWAVTEDGSGALWFTAQRGLYRLANGAWSQIKLPAVAQAVDYSAIEAAPDGTLWLQGAMPNPLLHLRVEGKEARITGSVGGDIIGSDDVSFIKFDRRGWLWVGTDLGVYVWNGGQWVHITQEDGLISDDTNTASVWEDGDRSMWFGTTGGVSHLLYPEKLFHVPAPQISVRDVRLNGEELQAGVRRRFDMRNPELSIELFSTYYKRPHALVFRYRLLGLYNKWQMSESGTLHFSGLAPGDYTLSVQAMDRRVHQFSAPIEYSFTVLPPWYQRERSKVAALFLCLLLGTLWWQISLRRLKTSEAHLKLEVDRQTAQLLAEKAQLERAQLELKETARHDALTGLLNRSAIFDVLAAMRRKALEEGSALSVIMADLDHFKSINDQYGHAIGDAVLQECAERFRETLRPGDAVGRYGGEELLFVIPGLSPLHAVSRLEEIRAAIASRPVVHGGHVLDVTCSFGAAWLNVEHRNVEALVRAADAALYLAKQDGRNRVVFCPDAAEEAFVGNRHS